MKFPPALAPGRHEIGVLEDRKMLHHRLAAHRQTMAQLAKALAILAVQRVQQLATTGIGKSTKDDIIVHRANMQPYSYMSRAVAAARFTWRASDGTMEVDYGRRRFAGSRREMDDGLARRFA
jgi:hypothetical protein